MDWHPIRWGGGGGGRNTPSRFMLQKPEIIKRWPDGPSRLVADFTYGDIMCT